MANKKNSLSRFIFNMASSAFSAFKVIPNVMYLVQAEARIASKNLVTILILYLIAGCIITTTWATILVMAFLFMLSLHIAALLALLILVLINLIILAVLVTCIVKTKERLAFTKTRHLMQNFRS